MGHAKSAGASRHHLPRRSVARLQAEQLLHLVPHPPLVFRSIVAVQLATLDVSESIRHRATIVGPVLTSMSAPLSTFGSANMLSTDSSTLRTPCTGDHRSEADSYRSGSSPGGWRIEMHTSPEG